MYQAMRIQICSLRWNLANQWKASGGLAEAGQCLPTKNQRVVLYIVYLEIVVVHSRDLLQRKLIVSQELHNKRMKCLTPWETVALFLYSSRFSLRMNFWGKYSYYYFDANSETCDGLIHMLQHAERIMKSLPHRSGEE